MGADLYSAGLLVQHGLSGSVAVPHQQAKVKQVKLCPPTKTDNAGEVAKIDLAESKSEDHNLLHSHHHHHHTEASIKLAKEIGTDYTFKRQIVWFNAIGFLVLHMCAVYGVFLMFAGHAKIWTTIYCERNFADRD